MSKELNQSAHYSELNASNVILFLCNRCDEIIMNMCTCTLRLVVEVNANVVDALGKRANFNLETTNNYDLPTLFEKVFCIRV